ncbi:MAG: glycosyltransferase family 39 protein [Tepidisphaeraceae bacterium]
MTEPQTFCETSSPAWRLQWLTPVRCRWLLAAILAAGFLLHLRYLTHNCPVDLSEDEAYYWDWSRQLDLSYYSKGPLVALAIRASSEVFGDTMLGVRFPSLVLAVGVSLATYWTTRRLFDSDRIALGAVLLNHAVPMFIAGSVLMTIDPLAYFFWALASLFLVEAVFHEKRWAWPAIGLALGAGFLAKFVVFLWLVGVVVFLLIDRPSRRWLKTPWPWGMLVIALAMTSPIVIWNARHGWTNALHVARDTGADSGGKFEFKNLLEFVGGQLGAMGPALWVIFVGAVIATLRRRGQSSVNLPSTASRHPERTREGSGREVQSQMFREYAQHDNGRDTSNSQLRAISCHTPLPVVERRREQMLLICLSLPFFAIVALGVLRAKVQVNWPVYAYFAWIILAAWFLSTRLRTRATWRPWRVWFWATVALAIVFSPISHNTEPLYRAVTRLTHKAPRKWDPSYRLRGWAELGQVVTKRLHTLRPGAFILGEKYQFTAELAFYVEGHPKTYCVGSWLEHPTRRARASQYDIWTDRRLDRPDLLGRDAIFMGDDPDDPQQPAYDLMAAFETFERLPPVEIYRAGARVRVFDLWVGRGFKGMKWPGKLENH